MNSKGSWAAMAVVGLAAVVTYPSLLANDRYPLFRDVLFFFVPLKQFLADALQNGRIALWNPLILFGSPFLAELQTGVLYPPSLVLLIPAPLGFNLFLAFHYAVALTGIAWLLDARRLRPAAVAVGALTFVIGGYLVSLLNVMNFLQSVAWSPWIIALWARILDEHITPRRFAGFAALVVVQTLAGGVELQILTFVVVGMQTLSRAPAHPHGAILALGWLMLAVAVATAASAAQVLPTVELVRQSSRSESLGYEQVANWSLGPVSLLQWFMPRSSALLSPEAQGGMDVGIGRGSIWLGSIYFGVVPFLFAIAGIARGRERAFWFGLGLAGFVLALGSWTPIFGWLYGALPWVVGKFRYPEKFFFLTHLSVAVLAAEGAHRVFAGDKVATRIFTVAGITVLTVALAICLARSYRFVEFVVAMRILAADPSLPLGDAIAMASDVFFKSVRLIVIVAVAMTGIWLRARGLVRGSIQVFILVGLCAADLISTHHDFNLSVDSARLASGNEVIDVAAPKQDRSRILVYSLMEDPLKGKRGFPRIFDVSGQFPASKLIEPWTIRAWNLMMVNAGMVRGVEAVFGGAGIIRGDTEVFRDALRVVPVDRGVDLLGIFSVGYLIGEQELATNQLKSLPARTEDPIVRTYEIVDRAPRAYLAAKLRVAASPAETFSQLIDPEFRIGREAIVETLPLGWVDAAGDEKVGSVTIQSHEPETVLLDVVAERQALLVLNDTFYPGWVARIDGVPAEIVRANYLVRGVLVPAGAHRIEFSYEPLSFRIGLYISAVAWMLLAAIAVTGWKRRAAPKR